MEVPSPAFGSRQVLLVGFRSQRVLLSVLEMSHSSDSIASEQLLAEFGRSRSESAFRELVQRHLPLVYNTALRVTNGDRHLAEDIAQIVFTDLAGKATGLSSGTIIAGWLHQHTWFTASKTIRTERRRALREQQSIDMHTSDTDASGLAHLQPIVDEALTTLNPEDRDALVLRFFESADLRRVGASFGISEDAAQKRVARALEKLRAVLATRGVTVSSVALTTFLAAQSTAASLSLSLAQTVSTAALAGVSSAPWLGTFLGSTKVKASLAALFAGAVLTPLVWLQNTISQLRNENSGLHALLAPLESLKSENDELRKRTFSPGERERLNRDLAELRRLRGEVTVLRRQLSAATNGIAATEGSATETPQDQEILSVNVKSHAVEMNYEGIAAIFGEKFPAIANQLRTVQAEAAGAGAPKTLTFVLEPEQGDELIELFKDTAGVDILSAPQIMAGDGQQGRVSVEESMGVPGGEPLQLGLSIDLLPKITPDRTGVSLNVKATNTEFVGWAEGEEGTVPVPKLRARQAAFDAVLRSGQMLILAPPGFRDSGEPEDKIQIYCFRSTVMRPTGEPVEAQPKLQATHGDGTIKP
jgi:RNA polymerase sigma factor (sigma-70 family)